MLRSSLSIGVLGLALSAFGMGCADAPAEEDAADNAAADTVAASDAPLAQLKLDLRDAKVVVRKQLTLTPSHGSSVGAAVGNNIVGSTFGKNVPFCSAVAKTSGKGARVLLQNTHYLVDAAKITDEAGNGHRVHIALINDERGTAEKGSSADWEIVCESDAIPSSRSVLANFTVDIYELQQGIDDLAIQMVASK